MKKIKEIHIVYRVYILLFFAALAFYVGLYLKPSLYLHVQQVPFLTGKEFFFNFLHIPGGFAQYFSQFLMQGMYTDLPGTVVVFLLILSMGILFAILMRRIFQRNMLILPFLLVLLSLGLIHNYFFPFVLFVRFIFVLFPLILFTKNDLSNLWGWLSYFIQYLFLYYLIGSGPALAFVAASTLIILIKLPLKSYYKVIPLLLLAGGVPYFAFKFVFNISMQDAYLNFYPDLSILVEYYAHDWFNLYLFIIPLLLLIASLVNFLIIKFTDRYYQRINSSFIALLITIIISTVLALHIKASEDTLGRNVALSDYYNFNGDFDKTIETALLSKDDYNISINLAYNRALSNKGELTERILEYPQYLGSQIFQPDKLGSPIFRMAASDQYLDFGYVSEAQHFAYSVLAIDHDNVRAKKRLVVTNILMGNYGAADTYLKSLSKSYHTKDFIKKYSIFVEDTSLVNSDPYFSAKRKLMPDNFAIPVQMTERLKDLLNANKNNILADEYLQLSYVLNHQLNLFMENVDHSLQFYNKIPEVYEQAILMYYYNTEMAGLKEYPISKKTMERFGGFLKTLANAGNKVELAQEKLEPYSDTYMYYVTYLSPKVTNIQVIQNAY